MVTAEFAVALPALVVVLALGLAGVGLGIDQVRCAEAVRIGARLAARAEPESDVRAAVAERAPDRSQVTVTARGDVVRVEVSGPPNRVLAALGLRVGCAASASAPREAL